MYVLIGTELIEVVKHESWVARLPSGFKITSAGDLQDVIRLCDEILCPCDSQHKTLTEHMKNQSEVTADLSKTVKKVS